MGVRLSEAALAPGDVTQRDAIAVTTPARTLIDLAGRSAAGVFERALAEATVRRLVSPAELAERAVGRPGAARIRAALADGPRLTRSEAERRLLALLARADLPRPRTNVQLGRYEVDALWPHRRLIVEVDGYAFHSGRAAFERDRRRDADLTAAGYRVIRLTWHQLTERPEATAARIATLLAAPT